MKKLLQNVLCCLVFLILAGCQKKPAALAVPDYPLDTAAIEAELSQVGLNWSVKQAAEPRDHVATYILYNSEQKIIALVTSAGTKESRGLQLSFMPSEQAKQTLMAPLPREDWENVLRLSARLYGGFDGEEQLVETSSQFLKESSTPPDPAADRAIMPKWEEEINDIHCILQLRSAPASGQTDFFTIRIYNNEEFAPVEPEASTVPAV